MFNDEYSPPKSKSKKNSSSTKTKKVQKKCNCRSGCSKRSCYCFKSNGGCDSTCGCGSSCQNLFNHLNYFFGDNQNCKPTACFSDWLVKKVQTTDQLQKVNREELHKKIMKCGRFSEYDEDEDYKKWLQKWKRIEDKDEKLGLIQKFFRMLLSDESTMRYYSFCNEDLAEEGCDWHCSICKTCRDWREWHCDGYSKEGFVLGAYGTTLPCPRCERKERMFSFW
ncbi:unnamed protein product [Adineta ricciae]|uniref:CRC domain-containing protein n=1 Tax=Adineta ricciae TaxID=249248 RepID=A0A816BMS9_ADIRI|nr:unnamed protein product [Adineta ricciae]